MGKLEESMLSLYSVFSDVQWEDRESAFCENDSPSCPS